MAKLAEICKLNGFTLRLVMVLTILAAAPWQDHARVSALGRSGSGPQPLIEVLHQLGVDYDEYFTIEEVRSNDESTPRLRNRQVVRPEGKPGLMRELEQIRRTVPGFAYSVDRHQPRVVHIIDARLLRQKSYGMSATIKHLDFSGTVFELISAISGQGIPVSPERHISTDDFLVMDFRTKITVSARNLRVREVLTDFVPLRDRGRVIWISVTKLGRNETSFIQFRI